MREIYHNTNTSHFFSLLKIAPRRQPGVRLRGAGAPPGFALLSSVIILGALSLLTIYFVALTLTDIRITQSHAGTIKSYYLAEAATAEMTRKIQDDVGLQAAFVAGTLSPSSASITRSGVFEPQGSYEATAESTAAGVADILSTGRYQIGGRAAKRVTRTTIAQATGTPQTWASPLFGGGTGGQQNGNITIKIPADITGGNTQANQNFKAQGSNAVVKVKDGNVNASNNILVTNGGTLTMINGLRQEGVPSVAMPQVDFGSAASTSWRNRANLTYTPTQFAAIPSGTTLNGIIYVTGPLTISSQTLTIAGTLVVNGALIINNAGGLITVLATLTGSGILVNGNFTINTSMDVDGMLYSNHTLTVDAAVVPNVLVDITGGMVGWTVILEGRSNAKVTIKYDENLASRPLDPSINTTSPLIFLNHWEEEY